MKTITPKSKIIFMSTYPPTQCGIATFTEDTVNAIEKIYGKSISSEICEITFKGEAAKSSAYHLPSKNKDAYTLVANEINKDAAVKLVHIQHEFGLFGGEYGNYLLDFLEVIKKPIAYTFHSVIPNPDQKLKSIVRLLCSYSEAIFVMTNQSKKILMEDYGINEADIALVEHGTHLVRYESTDKAKQKLALEDRLILSTFGLLGEGKSIETGLQALPQIVAQFPNVLYLILGKTHPNTIVDNIDHYRNSLEATVKELHLENNVRFVNEYLEVHELLDYLKATDVYLFTSKDPNQAVSGTFSYAMSCSCPIVASKIPHTLESLTSDIGILADIQDSDQFAKATLKLLNDSELRTHMALNAYAKTTKTSWENTALKHIKTYQKIAKDLVQIKINYPEINMDHQKAMTSDLGIFQFCKVSEPDLDAGYTIDDNARALIAMCKHYKLKGEETDIPYIKIYLDFIVRCQLEKGNFINYVDQFNVVEPKNSDENLEDSNGRAIWALGYLLSLENGTLPAAIIYKATLSINKTLTFAKELHSPRAIAFAMKGLYQLYLVTSTDRVLNLLNHLSQKLEKTYTNTASKNWNWFEEKLTYANSVLPEALLISFIVSGNEDHKKIALESMDFLISKMFFNDKFKIISNQGWHKKGAIPYEYGEQPIEACYMMYGLDLFYQTFGDPMYKKNLKLAFDWFLGKNHLNHIMYNPITGGCYDGLEKGNVNLNQGAESTVCYLSARLLIETYTSKAKIIELPTGKKINAKNATFLRLDELKSSTGTDSSVVSEALGFNFKKKESTLTTLGKKRETTLK